MWHTIMFITNISIKKKKKFWLKESEWSMSTSIQKKTQNASETVRISVINSVLAANWLFIEEGHDCTGYLSSEI